MTTIVVTSLGKRQRDGLYPVGGFRQGDLREKLVLFFTDEFGVLELGREYKEKAEGEQVTVEVSEKAWSFVFVQPEVAA